MCFFLYYLDELKELDSLRLIVDARLLSIGIRACLFIIRLKPWKKILWLENKLVIQDNTKPKKILICRIGHNKYNQISLCFTVKQIRILHKWLIKVPIRSRNLRLICQIDNMNFLGWRMESRYMISISSSHQSSKKFILWEILFLPGYGPSSAYRGLR